MAQTFRTNRLLLSGQDVNNIFYPLHTNPSAYITGFNSGLYTLNSNTGSFITTGQTGAFYINTGSLTGSFYPLNSNPAGYLTTNPSGSYFFSNSITLGVSQQFINFPNSLGTNPNVLCSITNTSGQSYIAVQASGISSSGYWALYSQNIDSLGYNLTTLASTSITTGINTIINSSPNPWGYLSFNSTTIWNANQNSNEDRQILILTGNSILNISGLYNGWGGTLKTIQSGTSSSGYNLTLPIGTLVINGGSGTISLTPSSGAIDIIGFEYDGTNLMCAIGNNFV